ncbi:hypothetical protein TRIP_C21161 [Candidatus Zixiibacteriota bacterium]|nr:hypothetical protein TRIP_C21161 [candidate division Zixibacteria bacterium]
MPFFIGFMRLRAIILLTRINECNILIVDGNGLWDLRIERISAGPHSSRPLRRFFDR